MASNTISVSKKGRSTVPQPQNAHFVLGSRPAVLRAPDVPRVKPSKDPSARDYGKAPPLAGDTGMSGLS